MQQRKKERTSHLDWSALLRRTFALDIMARPSVEAGAGRWRARRCHHQPPPVAEGSPVALARQERRKAAFAAKRLPPIPPTIQPTSLGISPWRSSSADARMTSTATCRSCPS